MPRRAREHPSVRRLADDPRQRGFHRARALGRLGFRWPASCGPISGSSKPTTAADDLAAAGTFASIETIYNPNKHRLTERDAAEPDPGEVWIAPRDEAPATRVAGRAIPGVRTIRRRTAWWLLDQSGRDVPPAVLDRAVETFLCNPASQAAIRK